MNEGSLHRLGRRVGAALVLFAASGCAAAPPGTGAGGAATGAAAPAETTAARPKVRPGITVLLQDSIHLIRGKRLALITNHTGIDELGRTDIDLLYDGDRARTAGVKLVALFAPEHGIRGTEDRENLESGVDARTGLPIHSLYTRGTIGPPDSTLKDVDVLVFDLQDIGTRTWTYVGVLVYSLRAARRVGIPLVVLDRPNPINGAVASAPMLDPGLANPDDPAPGKPGLAYALYSFPLRHGMTMGEMARFYNDSLGIGAALHVMPAAGWRRTMWFDETGLPWVKPSPNMPTVTSGLLYPSLVPFEGTNVSVGRGTVDAFQRFGASWMNAEAVAALLEGRRLPGVRFRVDPFTPVNPGDRKYAGQRIPGIKIDVTDRDRVPVGRVGAAILWALARTHADSLRVTARTFDLRFGSPSMREALMRGEDPDAVIDREAEAVALFQRSTRRFLLYR